MNLKESILKRIGFVIKNGTLALESATEGNYDGVINIDATFMTSFRSSGLALLLDIYHREHPYYLLFRSSTDTSYSYSVTKGIAILKNVREEVENGWVLTLKSLVSAEIFSDFLDMAQHLLDSDYKDAAAVMIGSVIEEHIRQLCLKNDIKTTFEKEGRDVILKADRMNAELAKKGVYNALEQKGVTAYLDLRNKSAHGKYSEYNKSQVQEMYNFGLNFIIRNPL